MFQVGEKFKIVTKDGREAEVEAMEVSTVAKKGYTNHFIKFFWREDQVLKQPLMSAATIKKEAKQ